jgi:hypothetical protein
LWGEAVDEIADPVPEAVDGSLCGCSEQRLELGEGVLDGIEVWAIGGRKSRLAAAASTA